VSTLSSLVEELASTGVLRASINLGNPVLAGGTSEKPSGVTVDIARKIAERLEVSVEFVCYDAARKSFEALTSGLADIGFLAVEPARQAEVTFTDPYLFIEGVFAVPEGSAAHSPTDVDRPGCRIGVKEGSAYDLYLSRTLRHATLIRGEEGADVFLDQGLDAGAGIRQPLTAFVAAHPGLRIVDERFMEIQQAVATGRHRSAQAIAFLCQIVEDLKGNGFIQQSLHNSGQQATIAPPSTRT
jgi:polar amino acid transport system substrate-binding protein